jgi:adenylyltransferase/sulfurtransferase
MPRILLPTPLRPFAGGSTSVEVEGATVTDALRRLVAAHEGLRPHLYDEAGRLRSYVNVYKNEEDVRYLEKDGTALAAGRSVLIVSLRRIPSEPLPFEEAYVRHPSCRRSPEAEAAQGGAVSRRAGGLGSPPALYPAAAGVGTIGPVDSTSSTTQPAAADPLRHGRRRAKLAARGARLRSGIRTSRS